MREEYFARAHDCMSKLIAMLKKHEGVKATAYTDSLGFLTIGAGRNVDPKSGLGLSDDEIDYLLENDIIRVIKELSSEFPWFADLDDVRKDAMIDISFNLGATKLRGFTRALAAMQIADYDTAAHEFLNSRWALQVGNRATELVEIIKTGTYSL